MNEVIETLTRWKNDSYRDAVAEMARGILDNGFHAGKSYAYERVLALLKNQMEPA